MEGCRRIHWAMAAPIKNFLATKSSDPDWPKKAIDITESALVVTPLDTTLVSCKLTDWAQLVYLNLAFKRDIPHQVTSHLFQWNGNFTKSVFGILPKLIQWILL